MGKFAFFGGQDGVGNYPFAQTIDPDRSETTFNYNKWTGTTQVYLLQAPAMMTSDYEHVIEFPSISDRDAWAKTGDKIEIQPNTRPLDKLRISIPVDTIINKGYNYIAAFGDVFPVKDAEKPMAYFYFILGEPKEIAPNTTELELQLDVWQTYSYVNKLQSVRLDRGHETMTHWTVDEHLNRPIETMNGLNCADVNFGDLGRLAAQFIAEEKLPNKSNEVKWYVCVGSTATPYPPKYAISLDDQNLSEVNPFNTPKAKKIDPVTGAKTLGNPQQYPYYGYDSICENPEKASQCNTAPTGDAEHHTAWNKYLTNTWGQPAKIEVEGKLVPNTAIFPKGEFGFAREAIAAMPGTVNSNHSGDKFNCEGQIGLYWFAIPFIGGEGQNWNDFLFRERLTNPNWYKTIKSVFLCPAWLKDENWVSNDITFPYDRGYPEVKTECWVINNTNIVTGTDTPIKKEFFHYDNHYAWMTKLYTSPYAQVEYIEPSGNKTRIPLEKFTQAKFAMKYMLNCNAVNPSITCSVPYIGNDDALSQMMFTYSLPQGMVNINKYYDYLAASQWTRWRDRQSAEIAYENAIDGNKLAYDNAVDDYTNLKTNANKNAESVKQQTTNNLDAAYLTTLNQYQDSKNWDFQEGTGETPPGIMEQILRLQIPLFQTNIEAEYTALLNNLWLTVNNAQTNMERTNKITNINLAQQTTNKIMSGLTKFSAGALSTMAQAAVGSPTAVLTGASTVIDAVQASVEIATINTATSLILDEEQEIMEGLVQQQCEIAGVAYDNVTYKTSPKVALRYGSYPSSYKSGADFLNSKFSRLYGSWGAPSWDVLIGNKSYYGGLFKIQKGDLKYKNETYNNKGVANMDNVKTTSDTIAENNFNTSAGIASRTKKTSDQIAKRQKDFQQTDAISASSFQKVFEGNITYGSPADNSLLHKETDGIKINIVTQELAAIQRAAEFFDRWGYAGDGEYVDMSNGYRYMKNYTYWKCIDVVPEQLYGTQSQKEEFLRMFKNGVTIHHADGSSPSTSMTLFGQKPIASKFN